MQFDPLLRGLLCSIVLALSFPAAVMAELPAELQGLGLRESPIAQRDLPGWKKPEKVVVWAMFPGLAESLRSRFPELEVVGATTPKQAYAEVGDAQVVMGFCQQEVLEKAPELRWVQYYFAGVEKCVTVPALASEDITFSNGQRLSSTAIADQVIAMTMALVRQLDVDQRAQVEGKWKMRWGAQPGRFDEVSGGTMLVVGLGGIGTEVARRADGLGMTVLATRGSRREGPDFVDYVGLADEALELAARADVVVNTAPLTEKTRGMFDRAFFLAMKPSAYFVSVGRGQSTVTADLLAALDAGEIAGAGLDVTDPEPLPPEHPLWQQPRVIITPHVAAQSSRTVQRIHALLVENLRRYIAGDPLLSVVDVKRGY